MAKIHGRKGRLYVGLASSSAAAEPVAYLKSWTLGFDTDDVDVTAMGDELKNFVSGLADVGGTYNGVYDTASAQLYTAARDGAKRKFYLYPSNDSTLVGTYWHGEAVFDMTISGGVDEAVTISGNYKAASDVLKVG